MTPNRVNRAHWPTKESKQILCIFYFCRSMEKIAGMTPNGAGKVFFRPIQTLPTFWATWMLISIDFICFCFLDSKTLDFHVPKFWIFRLPKIWIPDFNICMSRLPKKWIPLLPINPELILMSMLTRGGNQKRAQTTRTSSMPKL